MYFKLIILRSNINERSEKKKYNPNECLREARLK